MNMPRVTVAQLDEAKLAKLHALEKELGTVIMALAPQHPLATLSDAQVSRLRTLEQELGVVLLAYKKQ